ncbi:FMN-linked oxidoreductase [Melanomma pulvis-pyrius CBS 109.77]|uniref:FMN-linked oxidoreductase n=1 Tax=Melanomma pulvis-pyrius CBS 109.77 TaxID=1314802 RepID=A0A6A6XTP4_9PLEO|nr:FMN-linked oxidoreductase [Melanomma pulvis-pyrius CBS 109.77]
MQTYTDKDRSFTSGMLQRIARLGVKAIIFTVDVGWWPKQTSEARVTDFKLPDASLGTSMDSRGLHDRNLSGNDLAWIHHQTKLPIIMKGVQGIEDVELRVMCGAQRGQLVSFTIINNNLSLVPINLLETSHSNHGGGQLDYAPAPVDILYEVRAYRSDLFNKIGIMIDNRVRSGANVTKSLVLGAKAVGLGRTLLHANATHEEAGVKRVIKSRF